MSTRRLSWTPATARYDARGLALGSSTWRDASFRNYEKDENLCKLYFVPCCHHLEDLTTRRPSSTISHFLLTATPIMRTSSSIIAVLAFASAAAAAKSRRLRSTIRHHRAVEDRRAQTTNDSIRCTWDDKFDVNGNNHFKVCKKLRDEHTVPYTCDGQYVHVCCTVSSIEIPIFEKFGTCFKVGAATVRGCT